jgi:excisionase family DNA binding protein
MSKTQDLIILLENNFLPYPGHVPRNFYLGRQCRRPSRAEWYCREGRGGAFKMHFLCLGCRRKCVEVDPDWPIFAKLRTPPHRETVFFALVDKMSVDELLRLKRVLRVEEAAWALNVSHQKVRNWVEEGVLEHVPGNPIRVTSDSVRRNLEPSGAGVFE